MDLFQRKSHHLQALPTCHQDSCHFQMVISALWGEEVLVGTILSSQCILHCENRPGSSWCFLWSERKWWTFQQTHKCQLCGILCCGWLRGHLFFVSPWDYKQRKELGMANLSIEMSGVQLWPLVIPSKDKDGSGLLCYQVSLSWRKGLQGGTVCVIACHQECGLSYVWETKEWFGGSCNCWSEFLFRFNTVTLCF